MELNSSSAERSRTSSASTRLRPAPVCSKPRWEVLNPRSSASIELTGQSAIATADEGRVRQILRNLISNAVRYGGDTIRVVVDSTDSRVLVEVRDNGSGVPRHKQDVIFEPYGRAHTESGLTSSVGLGLSISRTLARLMGGDLLYDRDGAETTFRLTLPPQRSP